MLSCQKQIILSKNKRKKTEKNKNMHESCPLCQLTFIGRKNTQNIFIDDIMIKYRVIVVKVELKDNFTSHLEGYCHGLSHIPYCKRKIGPCMRLYEMFTRSLTDRTLPTIYRVCSATKVLSGVTQWASDTVTTLLSVSLAGRQ